MVGVHSHLFFFFTLVTGPRRSVSLQLSYTRVHEPDTAGGRLDPTGMSVVSCWQISSLGQHNGQGRCIKVFLTGTGRRRGELATLDHSV